MADEADLLEMEADLWAGPMGERWLAHIDQFESMISGVGDDAIAAARFQPGERVIDIGCGGGATSLAIAGAVAPGGSVTGLDISRALVAAATERAARAGAANLSFVLGDASKASPPGAPFDRLFSRFGVMFFADPHGAFAHMHSLVRPGGRLDFACWGPVAENPWMGELREVMTRHVQPPSGPPPSPRTPGPFAFANPDYVREILQAGGFSGIEVRPWRGMQFVGGIGSDPSSAARFVTEALPFGEALSELAPAPRQRAQEDIEAMFARHHGPGGVEIPAMAWFVSATA